MSISLCYKSKEGESGFPGDVKATILYNLNDYNELKIKFTAVTNKPTPINMANHVYFNLAGHVCSIYT